MFRASLSWEDLDVEIAMPAIPLEPTTNAPQLTGNLFLRRVLNARQFCTIMHWVARQASTVPYLWGSVWTHLALKLRGV